MRAVMKERIKREEMGKESRHAKVDSVGESSGAVTLAPFAVLKGLFLVVGFLLTANMTFTGL